MYGDSVWTLRQREASSADLFDARGRSFDQADFRARVGDQRDGSVSWQVERDGQGRSARLQTGAAQTNRLPAPIVGSVGVSESVHPLWFFVLVHSAATSTSRSSPNRSLVVSVVSRQSERWPPRIGVVLRLVRQRLE